MQNVVLEGVDPASYRHPDWTQWVEKGSYVHGMVTGVSAKRVVVKVGAKQAVLTPEDENTVVAPALPAEVDSAVSGEHSGSGDAILADDEAPATQSELEGDELPTDPSGDTESVQSVDAPSAPLVHDPATGREVAARGFEVPHNPSRPPSATMRH